MIHESGWSSSTIQLSDSTIWSLWLTAHWREDYYEQWLKFSHKLTEWFQKHRVCVILTTIMVLFQHVGAWQPQSSFKFFILKRLARIFFENVIPRRQWVSKRLCVVVSFIKVIVYRIIVSSAEGVLAVNSVHTAYITKVVS